MNEQTHLEVVAEAQAQPATETAVVEPRHVGLTTAVCKNCNEQIKLLELRGRAQLPEYDVWIHANSQGQTCRSRNGKLLFTNAEPLEGSISTDGTAEPAKSEVETESSSLSAAWAEPLSAVLFLMRAWCKWFLDLYRLKMRARAVDHAVVDECAKCPSCGVKQKHPIKFVDALGKVLHNCQRCSACWAEDPIAAFSGWKIESLPSEPELSRPAADRVTVSRHPTLVEKEKKA